MVPVGYVPPPPVKGLSRGLSAAVQVLFWIEAGIAAVTAFACIAAFSSFEMMIKPSSTLAAWERWNEQDELATGFLVIFVLAQIPILVVLIIWTFKSHRAAGLLQPQDRRWGIGWTIGAWFIPIATYVVPFLVIRETEAIASAPRHAGKVIQNWRDYPRPSALGVWWWVLFVVMTIMFVLRRSIVPYGVDDGRVRAFYIVTLILLTLGATSASLGALYIRSISKKLSPDSLA